MTLTSLIIHKIYSFLCTKEQSSNKYNQSNIKLLPNPIILDNNTAQNHINITEEELKTGAKEMAEGLKEFLEILPELQREKEINNSLDTVYGNIGESTSYAESFGDRTTRYLTDKNATDSDIVNFGLVPRIKNSEFFQSIFKNFKEDAKKEGSATTLDTMTSVSDNVLDSTNWTNPYFTMRDGKLITDIQKIYTETEGLRKILDDNSWMFEGKIGLNPFSLISARLIYSGAMKTFAATAFDPKTIQTAAEKEMRARIMKNFARVGAPQVVILLLAAAKFKPLLSIQNNIPSDVTASVLGLGLFKNSFLRFVFVTYASFFILHTYFPNVIPFLENYLADISIQQILRFNIIWISLFIFYYLGQLYYVNTINPALAYSTPGLPKLLPGFIKSDLILLYKLAHEDKNKVRRSIVRVLMIYVCIVTVIAILSLFF